MSGIRSALEELFAVDDRGLSVEELAADVAELSYVGQMVEVLRARKIKTLIDRDGYHDLGYSSPTAFLVDQTGVAPSHARRIISYGNAEVKAPHAFQAWADGRLSTDQMKHLFAAAEAVADEYPEANNDWLRSSKG